MNRKTRNMIIHGAIAIAIYAILSHIPPTAPLTKVGMNVLGIILGAIYAWCTLDDMAIPSLAAIVLLGFSGYTSVPGAFMSAFGHYAVVMILGLMLFSGILVQAGLARAVAKRIIESKLANGRPWVLTFLILVAAMVPSMFLTAVPVLIIVWKIIKDIFELVGYKKGEMWPALMMDAVLGVACIAMGAMPFSMGTATDYGVLKSIDASMNIPSVPYLISSLIMCAVFLAGSFLIIRFIFKPDVEKLRNYKAPSSKEPFTKDQKRALVLLVLFVILVLLPDFLPAGRMKMFLSSFGTIGFSFLMVLLALLIRNKDGSHFVTIKQAADSGVHWPMLLMIGAIMAVCSTVTDPALGITWFLTQALEPLVSGLSPFAFFVLFMGLALVCTNLLDNAIVAFVSVPIMYALAPTKGITIVAMMAMVTHTAQYGILLPASSPLSALTYGNVDEGWTNKKTILLGGVSFMVLYYIVVVFIGYPLLNIF